MPGVPIGEVTEVIATPGELSRQADVEPFAQMTSLNLVGIVIEPPQAANREAQPRPPPGASSTRHRAVRPPALHPHPEVEAMTTRTSAAQRRCWC